MRAESLADVIGSLYDCVLEPQRWSQALPLISTVGESTASSIVVNDRSGAAAAHIFEHGADQSYLRLYFEKLAATKAFAAKTTVLDRVGDVATMTMLAGAREPLHSDFYFTWVKPLGFRDVMGVLVLKSGRRVAWFSVARSEVQAPYGQKELRLMGALSPHVCRALLISDALELQSVAARHLEETVDALSTGIFLVEGQGRITYMNHSAERLVKSGASLKASSGRLAAVQPRAREQLSRALSLSIEGKAPPTTGRHFIALPGEEGGGLVANIMPLQWHQARNPLAALPGTTAVIVQDPAGHSDIPTEALAELYGLTRAESRVLELIARGQTPQDAADALGVTVTTVKTHLQKLFAKTETTRQAELVQLVTKMSPPLRAG
jgi:DNA-binding CsgD family transcriptional regulator/PAS domain-containing protein